MDTPVGDKDYWLPAHVCWG